MNMNSIKILLASSALQLVFAHSAFAYTINLGGTSVAGQGIFSNVPGAIATQDFNSSALLPSNYTGGKVVLGSLSGQFASPPNDSSRYYTVGGNAGTQGQVAFGFLASYFGFYGGSPDGYNGLELFNGATSVLSLTGAQIASNAGVLANGNQNVGYYFNITAAGPSEFFDRVVFKSTSAAFETDNHAVLAAVPEQETYLMMIAGLGVMGAVARRRE
ncbi:MAG: PEP-CTERM sorting domain-containing protein [Methylophilaceae bacterium]